MSQTFKGLCIGDSYDGRWENGTGNTITIPRCAADGNPMIVGHDVYALESIRVGDKQLYIWRWSELPILEAVHMLLDVYSLTPCKQGKFKP
jgi:hypothetical protein